MSQNFLYLLLSVFAALETVSGTTVTTSRIHLVTFGPPPVRTQSESPTSTPALSSSTPTVESSQSTASSIETSSLPTSGALDLTTTTSFVKTSNLAGSPVQSTSATSSSTPSLSVSSSLSHSTTVILASAYLSSSPSLSSSPPGGKVSPASSVQGTASVGIQPTKQTTTSSSAGAKGKTIGGLEIVGFVLVAILGLLVAAFGFYFFFFRKKMYPEYWSELVESPAPTEPAAAAHTAFPEVGITHQAFVGDAESPTNVTAPETEEKAPEPEVKAAEPVVKTPDQEVKAAEPEVKVAEPEANVSEPEVKSEVKENEAAEENFSEDSAL